MRDGRLKNQANIQEKEVTGTQVAETVVSM
jgi:hypothetical protein